MASTDLFTIGRAAVRSARRALACLSVVTTGSSALRAAPDHPPFGSGRSQARQLLGIHHLVHALGFPALNIEVMRMLEGLASVGSSARPTFDILRRGGLLLRVLAGWGGPRMPMQWRNDGRVGGD